MYTIISITLKKMYAMYAKDRKDKREYRILDTFLKQQKTNKKTTRHVLWSKYQSIMPFFLELIVKQISIINFPIKLHPSFNILNML